MARTPDEAGATPRPPRDPRRTRALAITALVVAVVPCCPVTGLIGALLGAVALHRLRAAATAGPLPGTRIAIAAILAGAASSILWAAVLERVAIAQDATLREDMAERITLTLEASQNGRAADVLAAWATTADARPTAEAVEVFGRETAARYGRLERVAFVSTARSGSILKPVIEVACVLHFERDAPLGSARFRATIVAGRWTPLYDLEHLRIEDAARGDLLLGAPPVEDAAPAARGPDG